MRQPGATYAMIWVPLLAGAISGCATVRAHPAASDLLAASSSTLPAAPKDSRPPGVGLDDSRTSRSPSLWSRLGRSATRTVRSPSVWAPATLSLLLQIDGLDGRLSDWARRETPVFGSQARAQNASNVLLDASVVSYAALLVVTPAPHGLGPWVHEKSKRGMAGLGAAAATDGITVLVKDATDRTRPDASNDLSFPSGHASGSAVGAALAAGEADRLRAPGWALSAIVLGTGAIAGGCAWARVEAGRHYLSDVLAGWALGTALGTITSRALAGDHGSPAVSVRVGRRRVQVAVTLPLTSPGRIRDSD